MVENCFGSSGQVKSFKICMRVLYRRLALVGRTHDDFVTNFQPLAVPGRVLVGEGVLTKVCRKRPKARQFFLFNDILVYGNIVINKKKVSCFDSCEILVRVLLKISFEEKSNIINSIGTLIFVICYSHFK